MRLKKKKKKRKKRQKKGVKDEEKKGRKERKVRLDLGGRGWGRVKKKVKGKIPLKKICS